MADEIWKSVKKRVENYELNMGPYFAHQAILTPRHLLFTYARYKFALSMLPLEATSNLLEMGCNEGLGTIMLSERCEKIIGVDFDEDAIEHAKNNIDNPKIDFVCSDFLTKKFGEFDAVVSIDVIEHINKKREDDYFNTIASNLTEDGFCIIGTPNQTAAKYSSEESRIGHVNLYTAERLDATVRKYFKNVFIFGMNDEVLHTGFFPMCHYLFVIGSCKK